MDTSTAPACNVLPLPALNDNYIWLLQRPGCTVAAVVDPGVAAPVIDYLDQHGLELGSILITHHHHDHTAGIPELRQRYPQVRIHGPHNEHIQGTDNNCYQGHREADRLRLDQLGVNFEVLEVPGHTRGHLAYYEPKLSDCGALFCGDTLFSAGCGRLFEGSAAQMQQALALIRALPAATLLYPAHEYTEANLRFARTVDPENPQLAAYAAEVAEQRSQHRPSLPVRLDQECRINPFLRWDAPAIQTAIAAHCQASPDSQPVAIFAALRRWKDDF